MQAMFMNVQYLCLDLLIVQVFSRAGCVSYKWKRSDAYTHTDTTRTPTSLGSKLYKAS